MPYNKNSDLPKSVANNIPEHGQDIYREAYNSAFTHYKDSDDRQAGRTREETAHAVAWSAVQKIYKKNDDNEWVKSD